MVIFEAVSSERAFLELEFHKAGAGGCVLSTIKRN